MKRRSLLSTLGTGILIGVPGCAENLPTGDNNAPTDVPENPQSDQTESPTRTPTKTATPEPGPQPPSDATYVVAQDGSGDYDSLSKALEVTQSGDVLRLKPGEYTWNPNINVSDISHDSFAQQLTFIGDTPENTKLTLKAGNVENNTIEAAKKPPIFHNLHLVTASGVTFKPGEKGGIHRGHATGEFGGTFYAYKTTFDGELSIAQGGGKLEKCKVNASFRFGDDFAAEETVFNSTIVTGQGGDGTGHFTDCVLNNGVVAPKQYNETSPVIRRCTVKPMDNGVTFDLKRPVDDDDKLFVFHPKVRQSEIQGRILHSGGTWIGNKFITGGTSFDYFFNDPNQIGKHPGGLQPRDDGKMVVWGNIFKGADVKFGGSDVKMYNEQKKIGNYYSEWDGGEDKDNDNISELPRPIPGESDVVDQYPLMKADRKAYGLLQTSNN